MANIGFIGLGHMGSPMAHNLLKQGQTLYVFDINNAAVNQLVEDGAKEVASLKALCAATDIIITMLPTGKDVETVYTQDGILTHARPGTLLIDCSTISVDEARGLHQLATQAQVDMIDAPVSGGVAAATAASLTFMVGGLAQQFERAKPILSLMGKNIIHAGPIGNGQAAKLCNNMILGISMIAISEAFVLGKKLGLDPKKLFEISSQSSGQCWSMTSYCPVPGT
jgi:3-hydroxyisobutyrate dehydrogenase